MYVYRIYVQPYAMIQLSTTLINQATTSNSSNFRTSNHYVFKASSPQLGSSRRLPGASAWDAHVHHLHMILLVYSLPSSESIEGKHLAKRLCHVRQFQLTILSKFNDFFRSFDGSLWGIRAAASLAFCWSMRC